MTVPSDREISFEDVLAFNDALMALAATGLPVELETGDTNEVLLRKLPQINARLALQVSRGVSLAEMLASDPAITPRYRAALESWFRGQQPIEALDALAASAQGRREIEAVASYSLVQPLIVLVLVYAGFIFLLLTVAPKLEAIYAQLGQYPSTSLSMLLTAKTWMPVWATALPLLTVAAVATWSWRPLPPSFNWLPGRIKYLDTLHMANYADSVARLIEKDYSLGRALAVLGPLPTESSDAQAIASATNKLIEAESGNQRISWDDPSIRALPALLRWAFTGDLLGQSMPDVLRIAARNYRTMARQYSTLARWWLPTLVGALLGGVFVLAFAVSLFWPMVELLKTLTLP